MAIGECGLDYSRLNEFSSEREKEEEKMRQKKIFSAQIDLAVETGKPLMIHCRDRRGGGEKEYGAHRDIVEMLARAKSGGGTGGKEMKKISGIVHFFTAGKEIAEQYLDLGWYLSFSGVISFAREYDEVVRSVPREKILAETDAPYAAPVPHRGKRNEPIFAEETVKKIAEIRGEGFESLRAQIAANAQKAFRLHF